MPALQKKKIFIVVDIGKIKEISNSKINIVLAGNSNGRSSSHILKRHNPKMAL